MNNATKHIIRLKDASKIKRDTMGTLENESNWKIRKKQADKAIEQAKKDYYNRRITKNQNAPDKLWKIIKEIAPSNFSASNDSDKVFTKETLDLFNNHFVNIGPTIESKLKQENATIQSTERPRTAAETSFSFVATSAEEVMEIVSNIPANKATGIDNIPIRAIKMGIEKLAYPISILINRIIVEGRIPNEFKLALTTPVHKKGDVDNPENYRPISVLPIMGKIMEKVLVKQLYTYLLDNKLISAQQHGFKAKHSTTTCLLELTEDIRQELDKGKATGIVALDLSKAFDSINHGKLLRKLESVGIRHKAHSLIKDYLSKRQQIAKHGELRSDSVTTTHGVPQGSILGPLLFIVYINDIFTETDHCKILSYADDTTLYVSSKYPGNLQSALNDDIKRLTNWFGNNGLMVNANKSHFIVINSPATDSRFNSIHIKVGRSNIPAERTIPILGVTLDKHLKWNDHVNGTIRRCKYQLRAFYRSMKFLDLNEKRLLYNSCLASRLSYADVIWSRCAMAKKKRLQTIQNMAARAILGTNKFEHAEPLIKELKWITLERKRQLHELVMFHKIYMNKGTNSQTDRLEKYKVQPRFNTRQVGTSHLTIPAFRTNYLKESFYIRNIRTWNNLPSELRSLTTTATFKARLHNHLYHNS